MCDVAELKWDDLAIVTVNKREVFVNDALSGDRVEYELRGTILIGTKNMGAQADGIAIRSYMWSEELGMYLLASRCDNVTAITVGGAGVLVNDALPRDAQWARNQDLLIGMANPGTSHAKIGMSVYTRNARLNVFVLKSTERFELEMDELIVYQVEGTLTRSRRAA